MSKQTDLINVTDAITVDSSNNVGIGTTSPSHLLDVEGSGDVSMRIGSTGTGDADASLYVDGGDTGESAVYFDTDGTQGAYISMTGGTGGDFNIGTAAASGRNIDFQPNNSLAMRIDSSGNVGIGTDSPSNALEVSDWVESRQGVIAVTDFSSTAGTNVTTTNATGVAATEKTVTKRGGGQSQFVYHVVLSHESDGSITNINGFFRAQYQINSGGWAYDNRVITVGGQGDQSGGTNNNSFTMTFNFTNAQLSKGDTLGLRIVFKKSNTQSVYFNQAGLTGQPSGTSNYCAGYIMEIGEA